MIGNQEQKWKDMTLKSLEAELHRLPEVRAPETLETKLLAAIPSRKPGAAQERKVKRHLRAWDFGATAAAAVLILALMLMVNYGLSSPSQQMLLTELNDTSLYYTGWDQNNLLYDQNNAYAEKTLPYESQWPTVNQNTRY